MARQEFYQPNRQRRTDDQSSEPPNVPTAPNARSSAVSSSAQETLGNIDAALSQNKDIHPRGALGKPLGLNEAENQAGRGPGSKSEKGVGDIAGKAAGFYNPEAKVAISTGQRLKGLFTGKNKKKSVAGMIVGGLLLVSVVAFVSFLPNEIVSLMSQLENKFFAVATHDAVKESDRLVSDYIKHKLKKAANSDKPASEDPIEGKDGLFDQWDQTDLMQKLADKGIRFTQEGDRYFLTADGLPGNKLDITDAINGDTDIFSYVNEANPELGQSLEDTKEAVVVTGGTIKHLFATQLWSKLFGTKWCVMDCDPGNEDQDRAGNSQADEQNFLAEEEVDRTVSAYQDVTETALESLTDENDNPQDRQAQTGDASTDLTAGQPESTFDQKTAEALDTTATKFGSAKLAQLFAAYSNFKATVADAMARAIAEGLLGKIGVDISAETIKALATKVIKVFGIVSWIQIAAEVIVFVNSISTKLTALNYAIHAAPFVQEASMFATASDEQKSGYNHPDMTELGSMANGLNANGSTAASSPVVETAADPNNPNNPSQSQVHSYAVQNHFALDDYSAVLTGISVALQTDPQWQALAAVAKIVNDVLGFVLAPINAVIYQAMKLLGINDLIAKAMPPLLSWIATKLFAMPNLANLSGQDRGTMTGEGLDVLGNSLAEAEGGKAITGKVAAGLLGEQQTVERQQFQNRPLFARIFATDTPYSLVSRLALVVPIDNLATMTQTSFGNLLENPIGKLLGSFSSIVHPANVFAASDDSAYANSTVDDVGVTQYGIPDSDSVYHTDSETYLQQNNCVKQSQQDYPTWNKAVVLNLDNGQTDHTTTNGCLLQQRVVQYLEQSPAMATE